jgi:hypothetical protein
MIFLMGGGGMRNSCTFGGNFKEMKKIILLLASYILCLDAVFSQEIEWQKTLGGSDWDELSSVQQTADGGYICGGYSGSNISGNKTENSFGFQDYWIIKLDSIGNIQWQKTIGGNSSDYLTSVQQIADGGYILGGYSNSNISGDKTENSNGGWDYWIVKTDPLGNIQWQNTIGGIYEDKLYSVQQTIDGGYILGGSSISDSSGDKTENNVGAGGYDYWVVKLDAAGSIEWQNTIGGIYDDDLRSVRQTSDKGYILGGFSDSPMSGDKTEDTWAFGFGYPDYWVVKLDSSGSIQWQNTIGGTLPDELYSIQQTFDGGYILGGLSESGFSGDKMEPTNGGYDYWVIKLDSVGNILWQNSIGGFFEDKLYSIQQTTDAGFILAGTSNSTATGDKSENSMGTRDFWVVKLDSLGNTEWDNTIGGIFEDRLVSIQEANNGGNILGGSSYSNISGDKNENCVSLSIPAWDYWIVKLTNKFNSITGKLFIDGNSNGVQDTGEPAVNHNMIYEANTGGFTYSQNDGTYKLIVLDTGSFMFTSYINYYTQVPVYNFANFSAFNQTDSLNDFAFQPAGVFNDLCAYLTPMGAFRAGFDANYMITYSNVGTTTLNGTVVFYPDTNITFVSSNITPTSITADSIVWNVGTLTPFQTGNILITVHVDAGTPIGTLINPNVIILPYAGDANTICNVSSWEVYVTGSVDPNAILVDRDTVLTTELSSPPYLDYIIYFQNTGNDTAFNARVLNNIPQTLNVNSFEFVASSHPVNINYSAASRLFTFTFDNINLPDSGANEPASHGFIRYRIKPVSTLLVGDSIKNNAFIYFDFNQPVLTDTAVTEIILPTGEEEFKVQSSKFKVFPNPSKDEVTVRGYSLTGKKAEVKIFDLFGREVLKMEVGGQKSEVRIDVSRFSQGVYIIELQTGEKVLRGKFLKE